MKSALCGVIALVLLGSPVMAQGAPTDEKLKGVLETLRQLNKLPAQPPARALRSRSASRPPVSPDLLKEIGAASIEFLQKYSEGQTIYGGDNRRGYDNATAFEQRAADATAVFVSATQVLPDRNGTVRLASQPGPRLCSPQELQPGQLPEPFWDQPRPGFCTGFKIGPDLVATAGHCVRPDAETGPGEVGCGNLRLVFGFRKARSQASADREIPAANVYRCVSVLAGHLDTEDWRIIRVDRIIDAPHVTVRLEGRPPLGERLTVVGHPTGLPVTISDGATVQRHRSTFFSADLDTYQGNSGSPVFNTNRLRSGELFVEGILVRGENDFVQETPCLISRRCPLFSSCRGEDVTYSALLEPAMRRLLRTEASKR
jgi:Trypsin-like peptidase domain